MEYTDFKDGNRKVKLINCRNCEKEWLVRKDRKHSGYCRKCKVNGKKNPMYGKESHNKGKFKYGISYTKYAWIKAKREIVMLMGNQCIKCKEKNMPIYCYEIHHRNPEEKKFSVFSKLTSWSNLKMKSLIKDELKKCDLICKNCHSVLHYGEYRAEDDLCLIQ